MKTGVTPELSSKWWSKNKAKTLGSTGLGKVLKSWETAKKQKSGPAMEEAIASLLPAVRKAKSKCGAKRHKETLDALVKYPKVIKTAKTQIPKWATDQGQVVDMDPHKKFTEKAFLKWLKSGLKKCLSHLPAQPDHYSGVVATGISQQLAKMVVVCHGQLVLYDYRAVSPRVAS